MARGDLEWLARRLDAFAKHRLFSLVLEHQGSSWTALRGDRRRLCGLALLDHSYHALTEGSVFGELERAGALDHRVGPAVVAGSEPDRFVPPVATRAQARARFLRRHARGKGLRMDWSCVHERAKSRLRRLTDPFALDFGEWEAVREHAPR
jgi:hypothetical protein